MEENWERTIGNGRTKVGGIGGEEIIRDGRRNRNGREGSGGEGGEM